VAGEAHQVVDRLAVAALAAASEVDLLAEEVLLVVGKMMRKSTILIILIFSLSCFKDKHLVLKGSLPFTLREASGIEYVVKTNTIWVHNDSGNNSELFSVSQNGKILKTIKIDELNKDWEDITSDSNGNLYIGDFGNNANDRKNLRIYKIDASSLVSGKPKVEIIKFKFEDQKEFPPKRKRRIFDAEGFFHFNNQLYIFTKSRIKDKTGKTNMYKIPDSAGNYKAKKVASFENRNKKGYWITAADISDDGSKMALLSERNVVLFSNFKGDQFFEGNIQYIEFDYNSQKEGLCFRDNFTLLITDEKTLKSGGNLYSLALPKN